MIRLFVALALPEKVRVGLTALEGGIPGARWMDEAQLHLTLRFIGEVDEAAARDIDDCLSVLRAPGFTLELAGVGEFGGKKPHTLWAGVRPNEALAHLQRKVETALQRIGLEPEGRKFSAHVTLARLKAAPSEKIAEFLSGNALYASGRFDVREFVLFSSVLGHEGSVYRAERSYALTLPGAL